MTYVVDTGGENPHINYEPSSLGGLKEAVEPGRPHTPYVEGPLVRQKIDRENNFGQAGERYRAFTDAERDELINNLVGALNECTPGIQERMVGYFTQADADYGRRVAEGIGRPELVKASNGTNGRNGTNGVHGATPTPDSVTEAQAKSPVG